MHLAPGPSAVGGLAQVGLQLHLQQSFDHTVSSSGAGMESECVMFHAAISKAYAWSGPKTASVNHGSNPSTYLWR